MNYLKQSHTQVLLLCCYCTSILLVVFANLDIHISSAFFDKVFFSQGAWWENLLYESVKPFLLISLLGVVSLWLVNKFTGTKALNICGRKVLFLLLVLILGSGIIVNAILKDNIGRARPRDIVEFNGTQRFTPAFVKSASCAKNCSFSSGHGSAAFFALALALLFRKRKWPLLLAFLYGSLVSFSRIASGGHFFSDVVISFFIMAIITDILYYLLFTNFQRISVK